MPLVMANAYYRIAAHVNALVVGLDRKDLGKRMLRASRTPCEKHPIHSRDNMNDEIKVHVAD
jgi:hypothetical protein